MPLRKALTYAITLRGATEVTLWPLRGSGVPAGPSSALFPGGIMLASDPQVDPFAMVEEAIVRIPRPEHDPIFSRALGQFVRHVGAREVLELGTGHGGSACWLATGLRLNGGGTLTTIDRDTAPAVAPLLESAGVADVTRVVRTPRSYTAELMSLIQA